MKSHITALRLPPPATPDASKRPRRLMTGRYQLLYTYLENRYANRVVLTFAEIEDLLGFTLPAQALLHQEWWTGRKISVGADHHSDSWSLANRTAVPNLVARTVVFQRQAEIR